MLISSIRIAEINYINCNSIICLDLGKDRDKYTSKFNTNKFKSKFKKEQCTDSKFW